MRKKHLVYSDLLRRKIFIKYELKRNLLKSIEKSNLILTSYRYLAKEQKNKLIRKSSIIQQINRCVLTGRPWYVLKYVRYSRFKIRTESYKGHLPGFKRASW